MKCNNNLQILSLHLFSQIFTSFHEFLFNESSTVNGLMEDFNNSRFETLQASESPGAFGNQCIEISYCKKTSLDS